MTGETRDGFLGGRLTLIQPAKGFRAGSDAVFLAAACPASSGQSVLDLGCGVGTAMYCLAVRVPGLSLTGVEYDAAAADRARRNGLAEVVVADVLDLPGPVRRSFDHVICNPPYFVPGAGSAAEDDTRESALREAGPGEIGRWLDVACRRVGPKGSMTVIARADRLADLLAGLHPRLGALAVLPLAADPGGPAGRVIVQGWKGRRSGLRLLAPFVTHRRGPPGDRETAHSDSAQEVLRDAKPLILT